MARRLEALVRDLQLFPFQMGMLLVAVSLVTINAYASILVMPSALTGEAS